MLLSLKNAKIYISGNNGHTNSLRFKVNHHVYEEQDKNNADAAADDDEVIGKSY